MGGGSGAMVVQTGVMIYLIGWLGIIWLDESWCLISVLGLLLWWYYVDRFGG